MGRRAAWCAMVVLAGSAASCIRVEVGTIHAVIDLNVRRVDGPATTQAVPADELFPASKPASRAVVIPGPEVR